MFIVHRAMVGVEEIGVDEFEHSFWQDEDGMRTEVDILVFVLDGVEAALQYAEQFYFFEVFALS